MIKRAKWSFPPPSSSSSPIHSLPALSSSLSLSNSVSVKRSRKDKAPRLQGGPTEFESKCGYIVLLILKHTSKFKKTHAKSKIEFSISKGIFSRLSVRVYLGRVLQFSDPIVGNTLYYILSERKRSGGRSEIFLLFTPEKRVNFRLPLPPLFAQGSCSLSQSQLICQSCPCQLTIQRTNLKVLKSLLLN